MPFFCKNKDKISQKDLLQYMGYGFMVINRNGDVLESNSIGKSLHSNINQIDIQNISKETILHIDDTIIKVFLYDSNNIIMISKSEKTLNDIRHQLKNYLNGINGYMYLLNLCNLSEEAKKYYTELLSGIESLTQSIDENITSKKLNR